LRAYKVRGAMWGALMSDLEMPGWHFQSLHGCIHGVSDSEVRRSDTRATKR
jgi:hypothetical protein